jgi:membrane protein
VRGLLRTLYRKAYDDNVTGLSAMVAYNLLLSVLPLALVALFVTSRVLRSPALEHSVVRDLRHIFPATAGSTITRALERVKSGSTSFGVIAVVASIWFGSSFWGALDTAFCRIYRLKCRTWLEQKRFAIAMLVVALLLMAVTVVVPTVQAILVKGSKGLPFGLAHLRAVDYAITLAIGLVALFTLLTLVYWLVPNRRLPWRAVWPGALLGTVAIGAIDYGFPLYLSNVSTLARVGTSLVLLVIVLLWFYAVALIILVAAVVNATRYATADRPLEPTDGTLAPTPTASERARSLRDRAR